MPHQSTSIDQSPASSLWFENESFLLDQSRLYDRPKGFSQRFGSGQLIKNETDLTASLFIILDG